MLKALESQYRDSAILPLPIGAPAPKTMVNPYLQDEELSGRIVRRKPYTPT
ncbi:hypothetical protein ARZXY2_4515 (plasmid) [Arthrobacter sp. ZXY-2]|nr:hypothetical protein ARZXY2_4515 [Arthrobacter sp. ZXY-2]